MSKQRREFERSGHSTELRHEQLAFQKQAVYRKTSFGFRGIPSASDFRAGIWSSDFLFWL